jgi:hypothetical protein
MSARLGCTEVRPLAPDVALDLLSGDERAAALEHLGTCAACRLEVEELASVADSLLVLTPEVEPSPEFQGAVLARMEAEATPAPAATEPPVRRWVRPVIVLAGLALCAGLLLAAPRPESDLRRATFRAADGAPAGQVFIDEGDPDRMTCTIDHPRFKGEYTVELVLRDGGRREIGGFDVGDGGTMAWTTALPVDDDGVLAVQVRSEDGEVRSEARLS